MMSTKTKKKLCWNCEGNVSLDDEACPYCGVSLDVSPLAGTDPNTHAFASPFKPSTPSEPIIPKAPYAMHSESKEATIPTEEPDFALSDLHRTLLTLLSLSLGTILIIFGAILFLFSDAHGIFTLHWHGTYWYLYLVVGLPLIYFGWKTLQDFHSQENDSQN